MDTVDKSGDICVRNFYFSSKNAGQEVMSCGWTGLSLAQRTLVLKKTAEQSSDVMSHLAAACCPH